MGKYYSIEQKLNFTAVAQRSQRKRK